MSQVPEDRARRLDKEAALPSYNPKRPFWDRTARASQRGDDVRAERCLRVGRDQAALSTRLSPAGPGQRARALWMGLCEAAVDRLAAWGEAARRGLGGLGGLWGGGGGGGWGGVW
jgi:hypothetical protein